MKKSFKNLFHGNLVPDEQLKFNKKLEKKISKTGDKLDKLLSGQEKELFDSYVELQQDLNGHTALESFKYGFKLGVRLIAKSLK